VFVKLAFYSLVPISYYLRCRLDQSFHFLFDSCKTNAIAIFNLNHHGAFTYNAQLVTKDIEKVK